MLGDALIDHSRLGRYWVGDKPFFNKAEAYIYASKTNEKVWWDFNDSIFSSIDWTIPIETSLSELYRQRAQQLRDKYDYVSVFFSGGVDSGNAMHAFLDNNILLDEIIVYRPKLLDSSYSMADRSEINLYAETEFAALPHLRKYVKDPRTKIRILDTDSAVDSFLRDESLVNQFHTLNQFNPTELTRTALSFTDPEWRQLYAAGKKVCHIQGADKPIIRTTLTEYYFQFKDSIHFVMEPHYHTDTSEMISKHQFHELFYWTPDLPQLVIKQCQIMKHICEVNPIYNKLFQRSDRVRYDKLDFINSYIYPEHVNNLRIAFCTDKPGMGMLSGHNTWFYGQLPKYTLGAFNSIVSNMRSSIDDRFFRGTGPTYYLDDPAESTPKISFRTVKSKEYKL